MYTKMTKDERALMEEKFIGVIAMLKASNDINELNHRALMEKQNQTYEQTLLTNGRVNKIEKRGRIFFWLGEKPIRILIVFGFMCLLFIKESRDFFLTGEFINWIKLLL